MAYSPPVTRGRAFSLHPGHPLSGLRDFLFHTQGTFSSATAWPAANRAQFYPFFLPHPATVTKFFVRNGATVSGNIDLGIYDESLSRIVSSGSTAHSGTNVYQEVDITDTDLLPGRYWMALAVDNTTATILRNGNSGTFAGLFGKRIQASTFPLPATVAPVTDAGSYHPWFGAQLRTEDLI